MDLRSRHHTVFPFSHTLYKTVEDKALRISLPAMQHLKDTLVMRSMIQDDFVYCNSMYILFTILDQFRIVEADS